MTTEEKINLIKEVGEEIVTEAELRKLLESGKPLIAYDGFEPSGKIHIAQGLLRAINVNKLTKAGIKFKMLVADWHAMTNDKMGGDLEKLKIVGQYFIEVWEASGMDLNNVEFLWASDLVKDSDYWNLVLQIGRTNKLARFVRTAEFMGREDSAEKLSAAQIIYPCMQIADIFKLGAQITQLGMDQRKVNMLAREIGPRLGFWKPIVVSHHMLLGLSKPTPLSDGKEARMIDLKMSKSVPDSAIFMTDSQEDLARKINKAYCPPGLAEGEAGPPGLAPENPILEYFKYIVFEKFPTVEIKREEGYGGGVSFSAYAELAETYQKGSLHPQDLKNALAFYLNELLRPVREHFENKPEAKQLKAEVESFAVTR